MKFKIPFLVLLSLLSYSFGAMFLHKTNIAFADTSFFKVSVGPLVDKEFTFKISYSGPEIIDASFKLSTNGRERALGNFTLSPGGESQTYFWSNSSTSGPDYSIVVYTVDPIKSQDLKYKTTLNFTPTTNTLPSTNGDIKVNITVPANEKEIKVSIKNNTTDAQYKFTTTLSDPNGFNKSQSGTFDNKGEIITQTFSSLEPKHTYNVSIEGSPVAQGTAGYITEKYTVYTSFTKPAVVKVSSVTTQNPPTTPDVPNVPNPNTPYVPNNPVTVTTPGTVLTPEQIKADKEGNGLVPCKNTCDFNDVLQLVNNLIVFLIKELFIPIIILLFMYAGYKYITANGNPAKVANLKKMVGHIVLGMLLVLCSWLIVKTLISILSSDTDGVLQFLK